MTSWVAVRDQTVSAMFAAPAGLPGQPERPPRVLLGHSMGGLMALDYTLAHPRGLVTTIASGPALANALPPWWKLALANVARMTTPSAGFPTGLDATGEGGVSRDAEVLRQRDADRLVHDRISPRLYFDFEETKQAAVGDQTGLTKRLCFRGESDRMVHPDGTRAFAAAAPKGMTKLVTFPGAYHEAFNDLGRDDVVREVVTWLDVMLGR